MRKLKVILLFCLLILGASPAGADYLVLPIILEKGAKTSPSTIKQWQDNLQKRLFDPQAPLVRLYAEMSGGLFSLEGRVLNPVASNELIEQVRARLTNIRSSLEVAPESLEIAITSAVLREVANQIQETTPPSSQSELPFFSQLLWSRVPAFKRRETQGVVLLIEDPSAGGAHGIATLGKISTWVPKSNGQFVPMDLAFTVLRGPLSELREPVVEAEFFKREGLTWIEKLVSHELGHMLGLHHAPSWECGVPDAEFDLDRWELCRVIEYGNPYDMMGNGDVAPGFNANSRAALGWLTPEVYKGGSAVFDVAPLGSTDRITAIKIPLTPHSHLMIERRFPGFGSKFDQGMLNELDQYGLLINWISDSREIPRSRLLKLGGHYVSLNQVLLEPWSLLIHDTFFPIGYRPARPAPKVIKIISNGAEVTLGPIEPTAGNHLRIQVNGQPNLSSLEAELPARDEKTFNKSTVVQ